VAAVKNVESVQPRRPQSTGRLARQAAPFALSLPASLTGIGALNELKATRGERSDLADFEKPS
jgi:hypothetical protein